MKNPYYLLYLLYLTVVLSILPVRLEAAGLKVSPAGFILQNIIPGKMYDIYQETGLRLTVYNDDTVDHTYLLSTNSPSEWGKWEKGYLEIPDPKWCWFGKNEITVGPNGQGYCSIFLKIPDEERYYNQHWVVVLRVMGKTGPEGIALAINVRIQIETESKVDLKGSPDGTIGIVPSAIVFGNGGDKKKVTIFNNTDFPQTYTVYPLKEKEKLRTYISTGFKPLPEPKWLKLNKQNLKILPRSKQTFTVGLSAPGGEMDTNDKWEYIIFVEGKDNTGFLRVRTSGTQ